MTMHRPTRRTGNATDLELTAAAAEGREAGRASRRQTIVRGMLVFRAILVLGLGVSFLLSGTTHSVLGNLLASYWLIGAVLTIRWAVANRGSPGTQWSAIAGVIGVAAAAVVLARGLLAGVISLDGVLAILGVTSVATGIIRLAGMLHDEKDARHPMLHRTVLGLIEVTLGVVLIFARDLDGTVATAAGIWGLVAGTIMLIDAIPMRQSDSPNESERP